DAPRSTVRAASDREVAHGSRSRHSQRGSVKLHSRLLADKSAQWADDQKHLESPDSCSATNDRVGDSPGASCGALAATLDADYDQISRSQPLANAYRTSSARVLRPSLSIPLAL